MGFAFTLRGPNLHLLWGGVVDFITPPNMKKKISFFQTLDFQITSKQLFLQTFKTSFLFLLFFPRCLAFGNTQHTRFSRLQWPHNTPFPCMDHITAMIYGWWIIRSLLLWSGVEIKRTMCQSEGRGGWSWGKGWWCLFVIPTREKLGHRLIGKRLSVWRKPWKPWKPGLFYEKNLCVLQINNI